MKTRQGIRLASLVSVACLVVVASAANASAYAFNCGKFLGSSPAISYRYYDMVGAYQTAFGEAQSAWDATSAPGFFDYEPSEEDPMVNVQDGSYTWGDWAEMTATCAAGVWLYNEVTIRFNTRTMGSLTAYQKRLVAEHEAGHGYGLEHVTATCSSTAKAVMSTGSTKFGCTGTPPWADDVNGVVAKY